MGLFSRSKKKKSSHEPDKAGDDFVHYKGDGFDCRTESGVGKVFLVPAADGVPRKDEFMDGIFDDSFMGSAPDVASKYAANDWYEMSANKGNCDAQFNLAFNLEHGIGVERNIEKAVEWYTKAAAGGNFKAYCCLGCIYASDEKMADLEKSYKYLSRASTEGVPRANYLLYVMYMKGMGTEEPNPYLAIKCLKESAEEKDPAGLYVMGQLSIHGNEYVDKSGDRAWKYFEESALLGCVPAMTAVGIMLCFGIGGKICNRDIAYSMMMAAADRGDAVASNALGVMNFCSMTQTCSPDKSGELFRISAEAGDGAALNNLAVIRCLASGNPKDSEEIFRKASENGSTAAAGNFIAVSHGRNMSLEIYCGCAVFTLNSDA